MGENANGITSREGGRISRPDLPPGDARALPILSSPRVCVSRIRGHWHSRRTPARNRRETRRSVGLPDLNISRLVRRHFQLTRRSRVHSRRLSGSRPETPATRDENPCDRLSGEGSRELRQLHRARCGTSRLRRLARHTRPRADTHRRDTRSRRRGYRPGPRLASGVVRARARVRLAVRRSIPSVPRPRRWREGDATPTPCRRASRPRSRPRRRTRRTSRR